MKTWVKYDHIHIKMQEIMLKLGEVNVKAKGTRILSKMQFGCYT